MALKIRLSRGGSKKRPFYRIVVAEAAAPRDGRYVERVGHYNPMVPKEHENRLSVNSDRVKFWMNKGAQPTDRVHKLLALADILKAPEIREQHEGDVGYLAEFIQVTCFTLSRRLARARAHSGYSWDSRAERPGQLLHRRARSLTRLTYALQR